MASAGDDLIGTPNAPDLIRIGQPMLRQVGALEAGQCGEPSVAGRELVVGCGIAIQLARHSPQGLQVIILEMGPDLVATLDGTGNVVTVLPLKLIESPHIEGIVHPASYRYSELVHHIVDGGKISKLVQQEVRPPLQLPVSAIRRLRRKLMLLGHNERGDRVKSGFLIRQNHKECLLFSSQVGERKIAGVDDGINELQSKQL